MQIASTLGPTDKHTTGSQVKTNHTLCVLLTVDRLIGQYKLKWLSFFQTHENGSVILWKHIVKIWLSNEELHKYRLHVSGFDTL